MKEQILKLRNQGKTYDEIKSIVKCSKSTISYYCGKNQKKKNLERTRNYRKNNLKVILNKKISSFLRTQFNSKTKKTKRSIKTFNVEDVIKKFGENPKCYLTGININLYNSSEYHFDHIIPRSKGGNNNLENLGLATKNANMAKGEMTLKEFKELCKMVLKQMGR